MCQLLLQFLFQAKELSTEELLVLDKVIARFFSICINMFIEEHKINKNEVDAIASHGHTIFHQPEIGYTLQIGCGATIAMYTGINTINNFRENDVVHGGQGAPLVPVGDQKLFNKLADAFLNIGGFSNITFLNPTIKAFDIAPGNLPLNEIVKRIGLKYDDKGMLARKGIINPELLLKLNELNYYSIEPPKSLGTEWLDQSFSPLLALEKDLNNQLATITEHIADQISIVLNKNNTESVLITGGGAKNDFLIERIRAKTNTQVIIPNEDLVDFKEAITFGFLGALFLNDEPNCLSAVTGAQKDVIGGVLYKS